MANIEVDLSINFNAFVNLAAKWGDLLDKIWSKKLICEIPEIETLSTFGGNYPERSISVVLIPWFEAICRGEDFVFNVNFFTF